MADSTEALHGQQLLELLAVVSAYPDEDSAVHGAVERAAQALEAEVAAVVFGADLAACIGFPAGHTPLAALLRVIRSESAYLEVPGLGRLHAVAVGWGGSHPGHLVLGRWAEDFSVEERQLLRGMARLLELTLTMLRTLQAEHAMRERSERQAAENAELVATLRQRQRLMEHLFEVQRAISRRRPLAQILDMITNAAADLLNAGIVGLWLRDAEEPEEVRLAAGVGLRPDLLAQRTTVPLPDTGAAGEAVLVEDVVVRYGRLPEHALLHRLTGGRLRAAMAAPVYDSGQVAGSLLIGSGQATRRYAAADVQMLRSFAEHVSLALTDANTVEQMRRAFHDSLTGLASRGLFLDQLSQLLSQPASLVSGADRVAVLFVDLDRFKAVNDTLGHAAGDNLLICTAERLKAQLRGSDTAARLGGDEFAVLLTGVEEERDAELVAQRILHALAEPMLIAGRQLRVNASIGIALSQLGASDAADLMRRADVAMYQAKRTGRGRYEVFSDGMMVTGAEDLPDRTG
ncbi:diguanylate cyclase (GGDEF)-like protein [Crossiella equi]|uniref:Diguanylate cyclase (GGDEF)-like protein n=1 Tax=Crossiella equi TaxID=130796 RepID=A0ABS5AJE8_9PSEU|nr:sensor domain-containing diguanylate cyclase [Crossiella equi]MBP2476696.1 diguanylate cyclase (GGDEF)-like protein [Crossiella equi]